MRRVCLAITIVTTILVVLGINLFFRAEALEHHGFKVDVSGGRNECISCHDDTIAKTAPNCMPICFLGKSHPDNKQYPPSNRSKEFKTVLFAQQCGIKFVNGKIDCISCHNLTDNSQYHLRICYRENLCRACHIR